MTYLKKIVWEVNLDQGYEIARIKDSQRTDDKIPSLILRN